MTSLAVTERAGRRGGRRWGSIAGSLLLLVGVAAGAVPVQAAESSVSISNGVVAQTGVPTGYVVIGTGVAKKDPMTISWGDGAVDIARTSCSVQRAKNRPGKCRIRAGHVYSDPGTYEVTVVDNEGWVLDSAMLTVVGESTKTVPEPPKPQYGESSKWRANMLMRINEVRVKNGAGPVGNCPRLDNVAQHYAQVMADTGHYGHTGPGGESPWDRMRTGGYDYRAAAENIAWGQANSEAVQRAWEGSEGHFRNMINPRLESVGLGAAKAANGRWYWVQKYGTGGDCSLGEHVIDSPAPTKLD